MRRSVFVSSVVALALAAAPSSFAASHSSQARAEAALLTLSDMPTGWATQSVKPEAVKPSNNGSCNKPNSFARAKKLKSTANAYALFIEDPRTGPLIGETVFAFRSVKDAKKFMAHPDFSCRSFDVEEADGKTSHFGDLGDLSFPSVGDQSFAFRNSLQAGSSPTKLTQETVAARVGKVAFTIVRSGLSADTDELQEFVTKALAKVQDEFGSSSSSLGATTTTVKALSYPNGSPVLDGYPKLVPLASIDSRVNNWFTLNPPPSDQVVELAPGVFAPYNPAVPDLASYLEGPVDGDCAVRNQYFPSTGGSCWNGVPAV